MTEPRFTHPAPIHPKRRPEVLAAAAAALADGDWARLEGAPELEADLVAWHGPNVDGRRPVAWCVASGTAALEAILLGHGLGPGDEVVTTPYTWGATVSAILAIGAIPRFADVDADSGLLTVDSVAAALSPATRAVLVVHLFGHPVPCRELRELCDERGILLLEDGSQAHGARYEGVRVGAWGHAAAFSCMGLKLLAGTEGGYALFADPSAAEAAALHGRHPRGLDETTRERLEAAGLLDSLQLGWRPSAVSAALVRAALPHLEGEIQGRRDNAASLRAGLDGCTTVTLPAENPGAEGCYHLLSLVHRQPATYERFLARLGQAGIDHFRYIATPIHRLKRMHHIVYDGPPVFWHAFLRRAGVDYRQVSCPGAETRSQCSVETVFNWTEPAGPAMADLAAAIRWAAED